MIAAEPIYATRGVSKRFGAQWALLDVDFEVHRGRIIGLVGANGAGKSTLMKILAGSLHADRGELRLEGRPIAMTSMLDAWAAGIAFVSQELNLFPTLCVVENLWLVPGGAGRPLNAAFKSDAADVLHRLGLRAALDSPLAALSLADRQLVEIARALLQRPRVLILDEPTSALQATEVERLHNILRSLRDSGVAIIYISHFLEELMDISDDVIVLRDGRRVNENAFSGPRTLDAIVAAMFGDAEPRSTRKVAVSKRDVGDAVNVGPLEINGLRGPLGLVVDRFTAAPGEVVGLAGLAGAGVEEFFAILFGRLAPAAGQITLPRGRLARLGTTAAVADGVAYIPADRKRLGLAIDQSVYENAAAVRSLTLGRDGLVPSRRRQIARAQARCAEIGVKMGSVHQRVGGLSGGNQQKVVFAKWLEADPVLMLLDDPMRGVDIGAKRDMYRLIREFAARGRVGLFYSSDPAEYAVVVDRALVFVDGRVAAELPADRLTEHELVAVMNGEGSPTSWNGVRDDTSSAIAGGASTGGR